MRTIDDVKRDKELRRLRRENKDLQEQVFQLTCHHEMGNKLFNIQWNQTDKILEFLFEHCKGDCITRVNYYSWEYCRFKKACPRYKEFSSPEYKSSSNPQISYP